MKVQVPRPSQEGSWVQIIFSGTNTCVSFLGDAPKMLAWSSFWFSLKHQPQNRYPLSPKNMAPDPWVPSRGSPDLPGSLALRNVSGRKGPQDSGTPQFAPKTNVSDLRNPQGLGEGREPGPARRPRGAGGQALSVRWNKSGRYPFGGGGSSVETNLKWSLD